MAYLDNQIPFQDLFLKETKRNVLKCNVRSFYVSPFKKKEERKKRQTIHFSTLRSQLAILLMPYFLKKKKGQIVLIIRAPYS